MKCYLFVLLIVAITGCYKHTTDENSYTTSYNILCAVPEQDFKIRTATSRDAFATASPIHFWGGDGITPTGLWTFGIPGDQSSTITVFRVEDSLNVVYSQTVDGKPGDRYNLLLYGTKDNIQTLVWKPEGVKPADSVSHVRFFNLAPDVASISINNAGFPVGSEVADLASLAHTERKVYDARPGHNEYLLEFIDKATGELLYSQPFVATPFTNTSIVFRGTKLAFPPLMVTTWIE